MTNSSNILFIDANIYLELYRTVSGKHLLKLLREQKKYIFVTEQVVNEVKRNKVKVARDFLVTLFRELKGPEFDIPDHLFGKTGDDVTVKREKLTEIHKKATTLNNELKELAHDILNKIFQAEDEVSEALSEIFDNAVKHNKDQLRLAKERKELGLAPGKKSGPLGDELNWEQILSRLKGKDKLWIISRDGDYLTEYKNKMFLNAQLYEELAKLCLPAKPEVFCFNNILAGIEHFAETTGLPAKEMPGKAVKENIKKEVASLAPIDWLDTLVASSTSTDIDWDAYNRRITPPAGVLSMWGNPPAFSPIVPPPSETDEES